METVTRKRSCEEDLHETVKRPRYGYYLKLASESSDDSETDRTVSVHSYQNRETDVVRDTSDTNTKSGTDSDFEVEYELQSLSEGSNPPGSASSGESDIDLATAGAIAAAICDSSLSAWITDGEDSDNSSLDNSGLNCSGFWTCIQCKSQKNNPQFQYCEKCFQVRKSINPPRPKGRKRRRRRSQQSQRKQAVQLENLRSCLNGLSQDSGLGSSQDLGKIVPQLDLSGIETPVKPEKGKTPEDGHSTLEQSDVSEEKLNVVAPRTDVSSDHSNESSAGGLPEYRELCIMCFKDSKNSIFLHGSIGHMACCYRCAMRTWFSTKRCPICQQGIKKVIKVFTF